MFPLNDQFSPALRELDVMLHGFSTSQEPHHQNQPTQSHQTIYPVTSMVYNPNLPPLNVSRIPVDPNSVTPSGFEPIHSAFGKVNRAHSYPESHAETSQQNQDSLITADLLEQALLARVDQKTVCQHPMTPHYPSTNYLSTSASSRVMGLDHIATGVRQLTNSYYGPEALSRFSPLSQFGSILSTNGEPTSRKLMKHEMDLASRSAFNSSIHGSLGLISPLRPSNPIRYTCNLGSKDRRPCDICGDVSAGFHCNAYVCEACKKFFIRSSKGENFSKYTCTKSNACEINKDTRTHCQRCRYQKCLRLGMVLPGAAVFPATDISEIPCRVCGAKSSGFHFGAITCEGCKGFFRRTINERESQRYTCRNGGNCAVTGATRNNCKSCRYRRCVAVGMSKDGSRIGRQPNAVKHRCAIEIEQIRSAVASCTASYSKSPNKFYYSGTFTTSQTGDSTGVEEHSRMTADQFVSSQQQYANTSAPNVNVICLRNTPQEYPSSMREGTRYVQALDGSPTHLHPRTNSASEMPQITPQSRLVPGSTLHVNPTYPLQADTELRGVRDMISYTDGPSSSFDTPVKHNQSSYNEQAELVCSVPKSTQDQHRGFDAIHGNRVILETHPQPNFCPSNEALHEPDIQNRCDYEAPSSAVGLLQLSQAAQFYSEHERQLASADPTQRLSREEYGQTAFQNESHVGHSSVRSPQETNGRYLSRVLPTLSKAQQKMLNEEVKAEEQPATHELWHTIEWGLAANKMQAINSIQYTESTRRDISSHQTINHELKEDPSLEELEQSTSRPRSESRPSTERVPSTTSTVLKVEPSEDSSYTSRELEHRIQPSLFNSNLSDYFENRSTYQEFQSGLGTFISENPYSMDFTRQNVNTRKETSSPSSIVDTEERLVIVDQMDDNYDTTVRSKELAGTVKVDRSPLKSSLSAQVAQPSGSGAYRDLLRNDEGTHIPTHNFDAFRNVPSTNSGQTYISPSKAFLNRYTSTVRTDQATRTDTFGESQPQPEVGLSVYRSRQVLDRLVSEPIVSSPNITAHHQSSSSYSEKRPLSTESSVTEESKRSPIRKRKITDSHAGWSSHCPNVRILTSEIDIAGNDFYHRGRQLQCDNQSPLSCASSVENGTVCHTPVSTVNMTPNQGQHYRYREAQVQQQHEGLVFTDLTQHNVESTASSNSTPRRTFLLQPDATFYSPPQSETTLQDSPDCRFQAIRVEKVDLDTELLELAVQAPKQQMHFTKACCPLEQPSSPHTASAIFAESYYPSPSVTNCSPSQPHLNQTQSACTTSSYFDTNRISEQVKTFDLKYEQNNSVKEVEQTTISSEDRRSAFQPRPNRFASQQDPVESYLSDPQNLTDTVTDVIYSHLASRGAMSLEMYTQRVTVAARTLRHCRTRGREDCALTPLLSSELVWSQMMERFETHAYQVIQFARTVPGFRELTSADMKTLVQDGMYPIMLIQLSTDFQPSTMDYNYFTFTPEEREIILGHFPELQTIAEQLCVAGSVLHPLELDEIEIALLCCIQLFHGVSGGKRLTDSSKVEAMYQRTVSALRNYEDARQAYEARTQSILTVTSLLKSMNGEHRSVLKQLKRDRPKLRFPDLYVQIFQLDQSDDVQPIATEEATNNRQN